MIDIPPDLDSCEIKVAGKTVMLTSLQRIFWPALRKSKRDLLLYYAAISPVLLPHLKDRAMVMKRYPNGIEGKFFFMKRTPPYRPDWLETCSIEHASGSVIDFPIAQDLASLLWIVNLGCIDLNPWYARCDDTDRPDFLHFDLDPVPPAGFAEVRHAALLMKSYLDEREISTFPKTSGSYGIHIYVPIHRRYLQKEVWTAAKNVAIRMGKLHPEAITSEYRITRRPPGRVLVDYNQNAWGRTLASVYSVGPTPEAAVSAPLTWEEVQAGISISDLTMEAMPERVENLGDLFAPVLRQRGRCRIEALE